MLCVGGGVLLATVFMHMIPEVRESLESARKANNPELDEHDHGYPIAELVICAGFFVIYLIEAAVNRFFGIEHGHGHSHGISKVRNRHFQAEHALYTPCLDENRGSSDFVHDIWICYKVQCTKFCTRQ